MSVFRLMSYWINKALDHFKAQEMCDKKVEKKTMVIGGSL